MRGSSVVGLVIAAKMFVFTAHGVAVTDYLSMERCEAAKSVLEAKWLKTAQENTPNGYHLITPGTLTIICVPA